MTVRKHCPRARRPKNVASYEPFFYLSAEDRVPRDAKHVVIGGSVTVVPPGTFQGCQNLERVELREGVEEIGAYAFANCPNLTRVDFPSSLRTISNWAFSRCLRLSELNLMEGIRRIKAWAFYSCALERIAVPSSVVEIGVRAFNSCRRLSEVFLREGLRKIGEAAFNHCALERIAVPSSVVEIGEQAFARCNNLETATLGGGMVSVARRAFFICPRLERITISSMAIVVKAGEDGNGRVTVVTGGIERDPASESPQLILASPHLASMRPEDLRNLTDAIDQIADTTRGAGPLDLTVRDVSDQIHACFVDHLSTWYRWYKREVATILELGLWKIELGRARERQPRSSSTTRNNAELQCNYFGHCSDETSYELLSIHYNFNQVFYENHDYSYLNDGASRSRMTGGRKRARADIPTRDDSRRTCGADPIVGFVLSSLAGPHRRADQAENAGSVRP